MFNVRIYVDCCLVIDCIIRADSVHSIFDLFCLNLIFHSYFILDYHKNKSYFWNNNCPLSFEYFLYCNLIEMKLIYPSIYTNIKYLNEGESPESNK